MFTRAPVGPTWLRAGRWRERGEAHARTPVRTDLAFPVSARRPDGRLFCERSVLMLPPLLLLLLLLQKPAISGGAARPPACTVGRYAGAYLSD